MNLINYNRRHKKDTKKLNSRSLIYLSFRKEIWECFRKWLCFWPSKEGCWDQSEWLERSNSSEANCKEILRPHLPFAKSEIVFLCEPWAFLLRFLCQDKKWSSLPITIGMVKGHLLNKEIKVVNKKRPQHRLRSLQ